MHRTLLGTLAVALAGPVACQRPPSTTPPAPAPIASEASPAESEPACRDFRGFDRNELAALPATPYNATFEYVWGAVLDKHYDPTLRCLDWPALRTEYGDKLSGASTTEAAYKTINAMLGRLGESHLVAVPPGRAQNSEPRGHTDTGPATVPIRVRMIEDTITVVDPAVDGMRSKIPGGAALQAIDDVEVDTVLAEVAQRWSKPLERAFRGAHAVQALLTCPEGGKKKIRFLAVGGKKPATKTVPCHMRRLEVATLGNLRDVPIELHAALVPRTKIGLVHFNVWMMPLSPRIVAAIADLRAQGMAALVIDLRGNPGGVAAMTVPLGRALLQAPATLGVMKMREGEQRFEVTPQPDAFAGPIAVLVDEGSASTSEMFAQALVDLGRARVYGASASQGAALPSIIETLPDGGLLQYVVADYTSPAGVAVEGRGVVPEAPVTETRADFAAGRDPVLDTAVRDLIAATTTIAAQPKAQPEK